MRYPDFFVVGAYKSGTTTLYRALGENPAIFLPGVKEPSYFAFPDATDTDHPKAREAIRDVDEYLALYAGRRPQQLAGDVSPEYLPSVAAAARIRDVNPQARIVAVLRNPVERAFSDYLMYRRDGREPCTVLGDALDQQDERRSRGEATGYYVATGFYGEQLQRYYERFPATQIQVHLFEDLVAAPDEVLRSIAAFLGVPHHPTAEMSTAHNRSGVPPNAVIASLYRSRRAVAPVLGKILPRSTRRRVEATLSRMLRRPELRPGDAARLRDLYATDIALLARLIGRPLDHWLDLPEPSPAPEAD